MSEVDPSKPTVAQEAALRYLFRSYRPDMMGGPVFDRDALFEYYERNGTPTRGLRTVSRRGAAGRMFWRLVKDGYIAGNGEFRGYVLTPRGVAVGGSSR